MNRVAFSANRRWWDGRVGLYAGYRHENDDHGSELLLPCYLVASSTPGHYHLFIDKEMD